MNVLGSEISSTEGVINTLSGYKGNKNELRYSAQTHHGNSGGPLLNEGGFVVGIVKSGLTGEELKIVDAVSTEELILDYMKSMVV